MPKSKGKLKFSAKDMRALYTERGSEIFDRSFWRGVTYYQLGQFLPDETKENEQRYFCFDTKLELALDDIDAASAGNIRTLKDEAGQIFDEQSKELTRMAKLLSARADA